jgi:hypothetical protein
MRNKPDLGRPARFPQANSAEQSQFRQSAGGAVGKMCQTKPNLGELEHLGKDEGSSRAILPNKSRFARRGRAGRSLGDVGANAPNKPNLPGGAGWPSPALRPSGLAPAKPIVPNKANLPGGAEWGEAWGTGGVGQMRQTKPIWLRLRNRRVLGRGNMQNKANSCQGNCRCAFVARASCP